MSDYGDDGGGDAYADGEYVKTTALYITLQSLR